jgi:hypothetical protein
VTGETQFDREERAINDARTLAQGGPVTGGQPVIVGEHGCHCCCHHPDAMPHTITVNVHGRIGDTDEIVQRILADIRQWGRGTGA